MPTCSSAATTVAAKGHLEHSQWDKAQELTSWKGEKEYKDTIITRKIIQKIPCE